jgi:deazaflavin-dependent oxidoreductase (nitroreductase family)
MNDDIQIALATERTVDITTTGKRTGQPRRIEIWFHNVDDRIYITGMPGRRDWYANLLADPRLTFHLKESVTADLDATALPVEGDEKRRVLRTILDRLGHSDKIDVWMNRSPLVEVKFA